MTLIGGDIARREFISAVNSKTKFVESQRPEATLQFIQDTFKAIAAGEGIVSTGNNTLHVKELGDKELRALCRLSKKFFEVRKDLHLNGEFLANIQTVRNQGHSFRTHWLLDPLKPQIYRNEIVDPTMGSPREKLQTELLTEIKTKDAELSRHRFKKRVATIALTSASTALIGAGIGLAVTGVGLGFGVAFIMVGTLIGALFIPSAASRSSIYEREQDQRNRMWAFELLQDKDKFEAFCKEKGIKEPDAVTYEQLVKVRFKKSEVSKE
ncbi:MAG: hypothetical protein ACK5MA_03455 [Parachlamydiaceae bacterium]